MKYLKFYLLTSFFAIIFLGVAAPALAGTFAVPGVVVLLKSIVTKQVVSSSTDTSGNFNAQVPEQDGTYDLFISDEGNPPVKVIAKNNIITGRIVILTDGTTTKDPDTSVLPIKKPITKTVTKPIVKSSSKTTAKTTK